MLKKIIIFILLATVVFIGGFIFLNSRLQTAEAGSGENVYGWAWSKNIGWISFNCTNCEGNSNCDKQATCDGTHKNYGVNINPSTGLFSGYAWSEHIGWIHFAPAGPYPTTTPNYPYSACVDLPSITTEPCDGIGSYNVAGWARALANGDGWDGWIKLRGTTIGGTPYGVSIIDTTTSPAEFKGWAWGGDDTYAEAVIGWISFNRINCDPDKDGVTEGGASNPDFPNCPNGQAISDYKVMTNLNAPPVVTNPHETFNPCAWGTTPQVADGFSVILNWTYSDPEGDSQQAYEIWLDNDSSFTGAKFNYKVEPSASTAYTLNLTHDIEGDWLSQLAWNTTYYWKVKVKDSAGNWSESLVDSFAMPSHASPNVDFEPSPQSPSVGELVQFCSVYEEQTYVDPDTGEEITEIICPTDLTFCYNATCVEWYWTFENGNPANSTKKNPPVTFSITGSNNVTLKVTDSYGFWCRKEKTITSQLPLPEWKEIAPF